MRKTWWLLFLILIIAIFLRTYHLSTVPPGLYPDEAMNGSNALEALRTTPPAGGFKVFYPENNGREGLFMNIQALFIKYTGTREPWTLRLPSAIFGILTVLGVFFFARELFRRDDIALLSSFFLATSFWHINFSRIGFRAITASFFIVWALFFFLAAINKERKNNLRFSIFNFPIVLALISGVFFGLGFYSYISYRVLPLLFLLFIPFFRKDKKFWQITAAFVLATFIVALPIGWYFLKHPADFFGRTTEVSISASPHPLRDLGMNIVKTVGMLDIRGDGNGRHNLAGRPELFFPVGILFWIGLVMGIHRIKINKDRLAYLLLFGWTLLAALPVVMSDEGIPHALRAILMIVPLMILAAAGGIWLFEKLRHFFPAGSRALLLAVFFTVLVFEPWHTYFVLWANDPNTPGAFSANYLAIGRTIRDLPQSTPKYVLIEAGGGTVSQTDPWTGKVHNVPIPAQTVMYTTDSFSPERQKEQNIHYVLPSDGVNIPPDVKLFIIR